MPRGGSTYLSGSDAILARSIELNELAEISLLGSWSREVSSFLDEEGKTSRVDRQLDT